MVHVASRGQKIIPINFPSPSWYVPKVQRVESQYLLSRVLHMLWNYLPKHVKVALTLSAFKGSLISDMQPSTGYTLYTGVNNISILDWAKQKYRI